MTDVASRELRNNTRAVLDRVANGEDVTITVDGRAIAALVPVDARPRWIRKEEFFRRFERHRADPGLLADVRALSDGETTDDLPWR